MPRSDEKRRRFSAQELGLLKSGRRPAFQCKQVDVFLDARPDGRFAISDEILTQQSESAGAVAVRGKDLSLHLDRGTQSQRQMSLGV